MYTINTIEELRTFIIDNFDYNSCIKNLSLASINHDVLDTIHKVYNKDVDSLISDAFESKQIFKPA